MSEKLVIKLLKEKKHLQCNDLFNNNGIVPLLKSIIDKEKNPPYAGE
jgi:hypothetical protein